MFFLGSSFLLRDNSILELKLVFFTIFLYLEEVVRTIDARTSEERLDRERYECLVLLIVFSLNSGLI